MIRRIKRDFNVFYKPNREYSWVWLLWEFWSSLHVISKKHERSSLALNENSELRGLTQNAMNRIKSVTTLEWNGSKQMIPPRSLRIGNPQISTSIFARTQHNCPRQTASSLWRSEIPSLTLCHLDSSLKFALFFLETFLGNYERLRMRWFCPFQHFPLSSSIHCTTVWRVLRLLLRLWQFLELVPSSFCEVSDRYKLSECGIIVGRLSWGSESI